VPHLHLLRGAAGLGAMYCFFYAAMLVGRGMPRKTAVTANAG